MCVLIASLNDVCKNRLGGNAGYEDRTHKCVVTVVVISRVSPNSQKLECEVEGL